MSFFERTLHEDTERIYLPYEYSDHPKSHPNKRSDSAIYGIDKLFCKGPKYKFCID